MKEIIHPLNYPVNKIGIINDLHYPFEDSSAVDKALKILKDENPEVIVVDGDLLDCWEISKFEKVPNFGKPLKEELSLGHEFFKELRKRHPDCRLIFVEGNHEFRIKSYAIRHAPALYAEDFIPHALRLRELGVEWVATKEGAASWTDTWVTIEGIHIGHFNRVNQGAGNTVRQLMIKKQGSFVQAHVHRAGIVYFRDIEGKVTFGMESPCLAKDPYYDSTTDFQRGLSFVERNEAGVFRPRVIVF